MKLATFNLYQFVEAGFYWYEREPRNTFTQQEWQQKQAWIKQQIVDLDADVIGFQEVFSIESLKELCQQAGYPYFATTDASACDPDDETVFIRPVVALASRLPLLEVSSVAIHSESRKLLPLVDDFRFSREPVVATIEHPKLGKLTIYVVHLKSKRPIAPKAIYADNTKWRERVQHTMLQLSSGNIASQFQRGAEATLLYHDISKRLQQDHTQAIAVLGDLNDNHDSTALAALTMQTRLYEIGGVDDDDWPEGVKGYLHDYRLSDSFRIAPNMKHRARPFTHIHRGQGNTLDHILVSNALNRNNPDANYVVTHYEVLNEHVDRDGIENKLQSDHGQVCVTLGKAHESKKTSKPNKLLLETRQAFIDLCGGVFQSDQHFDQWSSSDKWDNFWSFFFDHDYGWVPSVYGEIPVDKLFQEQRHSIEHIIPRNFLDPHLLSKRVPRNVRYGASINPFNFAPAERTLNAKRSSFPFDLDGDKIIKAFHVRQENGETYATGLDKDEEWVVPPCSRGDVARAILYMVMVYEIDELYNERLDKLIHWAKIDAPSAWEIAYNDWVYQRLNIRNPLIDEPRKVLKLLNNPALLKSL